MNNSVSNILIAAIVSGAAVGAVALVVNRPQAPQVNTVAPAPAAPAAPTIVPVIVPSSKPAEPAAPSGVRKVVTDPTGANIREAPIGSGRSDRIIITVPVGTSLNVVDTIFVNGKGWDLVDFTDADGKKDRGWVSQSNF